MWDFSFAERVARAEAPEFRRMFDLGRSRTNAINLSIGQPHFPVPDLVKQAAIDAIQANHNGYTPTQGAPELLARLRAKVQAEYPGQQRDVMVTSGTSGGIYLALLAVVNPGDEVMIADPYFVAYPRLIALAGGRAVTIDTHPDFQLDPDRVRAAITPRTRAILFCSPGNPTGTVQDPSRQRAIVDIAREHRLLVISDEIYKLFHYDTPPHSCGSWDENVLVIEGFGKTYGITGWRMGFAHGPAQLLEAMKTLQQFTYVCAPSLAQQAAIAALELDMGAVVADYRQRRDWVLAALSDCYEIVPPGGAFYLYPRTPGGMNATAFAAAAAARNLLLIPGEVFSKRNDYFRISYAATDETLTAGITILRDLAKTR